MVHLKPEDLQWVKGRFRK